MLLFLAAADVAVDVRERAPGALREAAAFITGVDREDLSEFGSGSLRLWALAHPDAVAAPRRYVCERRDEVLMFDGLPVLDDGTLVLDASQLGGRMRAIEGAGLAVRLDLAGDRLELVTAPLGLVPAFSCAAPGGGRLVSNSVLALRLLAGLEQPDPLGVSSLLALGWTVSDRTLSAGITALPGGSSIVLDSGSVVVEELLAPRTLLHSPGPSASELAERLVEGARGLGALGAPVECPLTAGRDSRICLAVLRAAGVPATYYTGSSTGEIDIEVASQLAARLGLAHRIDRHAELASVDARGFVFQNDGLGSLEQVADHPGQGVPAERLSVKVTGLGGEIARAGFAPIMGPAAAAWPFSALASLQRRLLAMKAHAPGGVVRPEAVAAARTYLRDFADARRCEGWPPRATGQAFYAFERVGRWAATGVRRTAATADLFSPFFSSAFLRAAFAQTGGEWVVERLHHRLMSELDPELRDAPYSNPWPAQRPRLAGVYSTAASMRALAERVRDGARPQDTVEDARGWVAGDREPHLEVVGRARGSALEDYIDLGQLERKLSEGAPADAATLRALTAVWWFAGLEA